jgi:hypothetical protein
MYQHVEGVTRLASVDIYVQNLIPAARYENAEQKEEAVE